MNDRVASLRRWLLGGGILLMAVIAAFITYARFVSRLHHIKIPGKLGVNVVREAGGWTLSRSKGPKTLYTIHAAKLDQGRNGKSALHDVSITVYGANGDRRDRIYGQDFEYDEKDGIIRALGQVHIDLQGADAQSSETAAPQPSPANPDEAVGPKVIHVTTSGLVYLEKLGLAATSDYIEFRAGGMTGHATGADYSSDSGVLSLHSAVSMTGSSQGQPMQLTAATAQFDQRTQQAMLTGVRYDSAGRHAEAAQSTLYRRANGTIGRVEAGGDVMLVENGARLAAQRADIALNSASQPESALLTGGVHYLSDEPLRKVTGHAEQAHISFTGEKKPQPQQADFRGAVHIFERIRQSAEQQAWSTRELTADRFEAAIAPDGTELRSAEASGNARLVMIDAPEGRRNVGERDIAGDDLKAKLVPGNRPKAGAVLDSLSGTGHTFVRQVSADGVEEKSSGDTLTATFRHGVVHGGAGGQPANSLRNAVQEGHVSVERTLRGKPNGGAAPAANEIQHAIAGKAVYDGDADQLTLTGAVRVSDADGVLWAKQAVLDRASGDARMTGAVKADYVQQTAAGSPADRNRQPVEPTHIIADRATSQRTSGITTFFGSPVRVWQGGSQVQAPEVEISRKQQHMVAHGPAGATGLVVRTILASAATTAQGGTGRQSRSATAPQCAVSSAAHTPGASTTTPSQSSALRITSGRLAYSGADREAVFSGGVRVDSADTVMRATEATAYLQKPAAGRNQPTLQLDGGLDRVIATGQITIARPGLNATGSRLVYTTDTGTFLLTGDKGAPPTAVGPQGTTTAAALRLNSCDDSVEALGAVPGEPVERVSTNSTLSREKGQSKAR